MHNAHMLNRFLVVLTASAAVTACGSSRTPVTPSAAIAPAGSYVISGTVSAVTDDGTMPLASAGVVATNGQFTRVGRTDDSGQFVLDGLTAGRWTVTVTRHGYIGDARDVTIEDGDASVSFQLALDDTGRDPRPAPLSRR